MTPDLPRIASVYAQAYVWYTVNGATPRGTGRRAGKPGSKAPAGADRQLRTCLVETARAISDATWHLGHHDLPTKPWRPVSFVTGGKLTVFLGRPWTEVVARHTCADCGVRWNLDDPERTPHTHACKHPQEQINIALADRWAPDPDDMAVLVTHPHQIRFECQRLKGHLGLLETRGIGCEGCSGSREHLPGPADDPHLHRALQALRRAGGSMRRTRMWERPRVETQADRCSNTPCMNYPRKGGKECGTCANWRSRHDEARPVNREAEDEVA